MAEHLWAWLVIEDDGREGIVAAFAGETFMPLVTTSEEVATKLFRKLADRHHDAADKTMRLVRFKRDEVEEEINE